ncbi:MAG: PAS domain-containing protein [Acidobacteriaceae bacterium]
MASSPHPALPARVVEPSLLHPVKRKRHLYERRIRLFSLLSVVPALATATVLISLQSWTLGSKLALIALLVFLSLILEALLHEQVVRPLQTLANVISALREEDYSFRARGAAPNDALGELAHEVNTLADLLADQRTHAIEASELLRRVIEEIDVPLFTFDRDQSLKLVNSAGERLLQQPSSRLLGRSADDIGLAPYLKSRGENHAAFSPFNPNSR